MPNTFSLAATGYTTVQLNNSTILTLDYSLPAARPQYEEIDQLEDGSEITDARLATMTGSLRLLVTGGSETAVQNSIRSIERLLDIARRWRRTGTKVYLQVQLGNESDTWRTQILAGQLDTPNVADELTRLKVNATLAITRRFFWEGPETQLDLTTSANGTPTSEPTFYVDDDAVAAQTNWIQIAASEIEGSLRAPLKLKLKNTAGVSVNWRDFHIGHNAFSDPANFDPFLLGGEADGGASASWSSGATQAVLYNWDPALGYFSDARLADLGGRMFRILAAFDSLTVSGTAYFQLHISMVVGASHTFLWSSGEVAITGASKDELLDFGALPIPPGGFTGAGSSIGVAIRARAANGGSCVLDFIQMTPIDSYRKIVKFGFSNPNNEMLVDDGIDGLVYTENASGQQWPVWTPLARPIYVYPNKLQRLYVLTRESTGWVSGRQMTAQASYRPRRLTV